MAQMFPSHFGRRFLNFFNLPMKKKNCFCVLFGELTVRFSAAQVINIVAGCITKEFKEEETSVRE